MKLPSTTSIIDEFRKKLRSPILRNIITVAGVIFGIKLISFYKETFIASEFGLSLLLDTFLIAVLIPSFIQNVFIGALQNIFIPNYITELSTTKKLGEFQGLVFGIVLLIMIFFASLTLLSSDFFVDIVFPNKSFQFYELVKKQLIIVVPSLFFMGLSSIISSLLEIENRFFLTSLAGFFPAISTIIVIVYFQNSLGDTVLAVGFLSGVILSFLYLLYFGLRYRVIKLATPALNKNSKIMLKQLPPKLTSGFLVDINPFVDQFFAAQLAVGAISALNYGTKIPSFTTSIAVIALGNVILPYFSREIVNNLLSAYEKMFKMMGQLFVLSTIFTLIIIFFSKEIIEFLFERDSFTKEDSEIVGYLQQILLAYVPFKICGVIMVKFLTSINENVFMAWMSFISVIINLILNIVFVKVYGIFGLAMSTTLVLIIRTIIYYLYTRRLYTQFLKL